MTGDETRQVVHELLIAFPNLADDGERCDDISRRLMAYPSPVARQAVDEYINHGGSKYFELPRLMSVVDRIFRQEQEQAAQREQARRLHEEQLTQAQIQQRLRQADEIISQMTDELVMEEAAPLIIDLQMKGADVAAEWAKKRTPDQWRHNFGLRMRVAGMLQPNG